MTSVGCPGARVDGGARTAAAVRGCRCRSSRAVGREDARAVPDVERTAGRGGGSDRTGGRYGPAGGAVDLPGPWTPAGGRADSRGRRSGHPQAVGNLADERRRSAPASRPRDSHGSTAHCCRGSSNTGTRSGDGRPRREPALSATTGAVPSVTAVGPGRKTRTTRACFAIGIHLDEALELSKRPGPPQPTGEPCGPTLSLNEGRGVNPGDTRARLAVYRHLAARSTKAGA